MNYWTLITRAKLKQLAILNLSGTVLDIEGTNLNTYVVT
jgi:hypothetical protein